MPPAMDNKIAVKANPKIPSSQQIPSVQSFWQKEVRVDKGDKMAIVAASAGAGDGFTEEELAATLDPLYRRWNPETEYDELCIENLAPGPNPVTFMGRISNLSTKFGASQKQPKAKGWHCLIVKDDSAAIAIKLYFAHRPYPLKLGQLLSFWTRLISDSSRNETGSITHVNISANLFPGRVTSDHVMIHTSAATDSICHIPLEYQKCQELPGLMTVESWLRSGHDGVAGVKILVCVKSIGATRKFSKKTGGECKLADIILFDHTGDVKMLLWNELIESARDWVPGKTILLVSNPGYKIGNSNQVSVGVQFQSIIDVEPEFEEAEWLRKYASGLTKKEALCLEWPEDIFDEDTVDAAHCGVVRMLFTLAEFDSWVRSDGHQTFTGFINVTIMDMALGSLHRRNMLMGAECCGVPIFANSRTTPCRNCSKPLTLSINPKIIGTLADETGCIAPGKLLWSARAWEELLGRPVEEFTVITEEEARLFEQRMLFLRMHLVVGWSEEVGRLAVLGMKA